MFRLQKLFAISSVILRDNVKIMSLKVGNSDRFRNTNRMAVGR